jgi:hypothetical protein
MRIRVPLIMLAAGALLCGCHETTVTHAVSVKVGTDGARTVTETKTVTQYVEVPDTESTKAILKEFDNK